MKKEKIIEQIWIDFIKSYAKANNLLLKDFRKRLKKYATKKKAKRKTKSFKS